MNSDQSDLFGKPTQGDLFGPPDAVDYTPNADAVRAELLAILAMARAAESLPWSPRDALYYQTIFPQMTNWLPEEEAAQLRFEFETEMARLRAA